MDARWTLLTGLTLALVLGAAADGTAIVVCPAGSTVQGVDVSAYQGTVDWTEVAGAGVAFAFARIANGLTADTTFAANYAGIKAAGLIRGGYQTLRPGQDPVAQAELALASVGTVGPGDLAPALLVEVTDGQSAAVVCQAVEEWCSVIQDATGRTPFICTGRGFWNGNVSCPGAAENPLWIAAWNVACPNTPDIWSDWDFWQYVSDGSVPGITGSVDRNVFNGPLSALQAIAGMASSHVPPEAPWGLRICPNPFNPQATIVFEVPVAGEIRLSVIDMAGRLVRTLLDESITAGSHEAAWDGRDATGREVASGTYLARLERGGEVAVARMELIR